MEQAGACRVACCCTFVYFRFKDSSKSAPFILLCSAYYVAPIKEANVAFLSSNVCQFTTQPSFIAFISALFAVMTLSASIASSAVLSALKHHSLRSRGFLSNQISNVLDEVDRGQVSGSLLPKLRFLRTITSRPFITAACVDCECRVVCDTLRENHVFAPVETSIFEYILRLTREEDRVVVDVGANIGYFTFLSSAWGAKVYSFEPNVHAAALLRVGAALQPEHAQRSIHFFPNAVGAKEEEQRVTFPENQGWAFGKIERKGEKEGSVAPAAAHATTRNDGNGGAAIQVSRLSSLLTLTQQITILKVDTEGYESSVFDGAYDTLKNVEYVIAEIKEFNSVAKRDLMHRIMQNGDFAHVYTYEEQYSSKLYPPAAILVQDVTNIVVSKLHDEEIQFEDFVFSRRVLHLI
jgi:FkbM family methyltransferase